MEGLPSYFVYLAMSASVVISIFISTNFCQNYNNFVMNLVPSIGSCNPMFWFQECLVTKYYDSFQTLFHASVRAQCID